MFSFCQTMWYRLPFQNNVKNNVYRLPFQNNVYRAVNFSKPVRLLITTNLFPGAAFSGGSRKGYFDILTNLHLKVPLTASCMLQISIFLTSHPPAEILNQVLKIQGIKTRSLETKRNDPNNQNKDLIYCKTDTMALKFMARNCRNIRFRYLTKKNRP